MEQLQTATGISEMDIAARLALAVQGTFIIFFVVSPVMGYLLARGIEKRVNLVLGWCIGVLVILVGSFGLNLLLRRLIPETTLPDAVIIVLSAMAAAASGILLARFLIWWLADPGKPAWAVEYENLPEDELMPFEKRHRQEMERRKRR